MSLRSVKPSVEQRTDCEICWFFKRPPRKKPVMMIVLRLFPDAKGLALCRTCLRNLGSMMKNKNKKPRSQET